MEGNRNRARGGGAATVVQGEPPFHPARREAGKKHEKRGEKRTRAGPTKLFGPGKGKKDSRYRPVGKKKNQTKKNEDGPGITETRSPKKFRSGRGARTEKRVKVSADQNSRRGGEAIRHGGKMGIRITRGEDGPQMGHNRVEKA